MASQAIAGTIDIVLTRAARAQPPELKLAAAERDGLGSAYADFSLAGRSDSQRWALSAGLREQRERWLAHLSQTAFDPFGRVTQQRRADREARGTRAVAACAARSWQDGERQRVGVELVAAATPSSTTARTTSVWRSPAPRPPTRPTTSRWRCAPPSRGRA
ncbi:MAG: hypothetical protein U1F25_11270 [Rubrivivax sp.]